MMRNKKKKIKTYVSLIFLGIIIGFFIGAIFAATGVATMMTQYPVLSCIANLEDSLNIEKNKIPFTKESQREAIQWRCSTEHVQYNETYDSILKYTGEKRNVTE